MRIEVERAFNVIVPFLEENKTKRVSLARLRQLIFRARDRLIRLAVSEAVDRSLAKVVYRDVWAHPSYVIPSKPDSRVVSMKHMRSRLAEDRLIRYLSRSPRTTFEVAAFINKAESDVPAFTSSYITAKVIRFDGSFYSIVDNHHDLTVRHAS